MKPIQKKTPRVSYVFAVFIFLGLIFFADHLIYENRYKFSFHFNKNSYSVDETNSDLIIPFEVFDLDHLQSLNQSNLLEGLDLKRETRGRSYFDAVDYSEYRLVKNTVQTSNGRVLFNSTYTEDLKNRRLTSPQGSKIRSETAILLLGCSLTYGIGNNDEQTFAWQLQKKANNAKVWNLGIQAAGPNDIYERFVINNDSLFDVPEKKLILVYGFVGDHLRRLSCDSSCFDVNKKYLINKPRYELIDGKILKLGKHADFYRMPLLYPLANLFKSLIHGPLVIPPIHSQKNFNLLEAMFDKIVNKFKEKHEVLDFYQIYLDGNSSQLQPMLTQSKLNKKNILLPLEKLEQKIKKADSQFSPLWIPLDGHFTPVSNAIVSRALEYRLKKDHPNLFKAGNSD